MRKMPNRLVDITVVVPVRNANSTIIKTLDGIRQQRYSVQEVILVDNVSKDDTVATAKEYQNHHPKFPLRIIENKKDLMVAGSFNKGITQAKTHYVVTMHGDCCFASSSELSKLVAPFFRDKNVIATYGIVENPIWVWKKYPFWEKCLLAPDAGKSAPGLVGKIDCYHKKTLLSVGAYDSVVYAEYGGEDADLHLRLRLRGKIVQTPARVLHLHSLSKHFSLFDWIRKKKATARTYGRLLRVQGFRLGIRGILAFLAKPFLAIGVFVPGLTIISLSVLAIFLFWYYNKLFRTTETLHDPHILLVPLVGFFLVYYETFWIIESFFQGVEQRYGKS